MHLLRFLRNGNFVTPGLNLYTQDIYFLFTQVKNDVWEECFYCLTTTSLNRHIKLFLLTSTHANFLVFDQSSIGGDFTTPAFSNFESVV